MASELNTTQETNEARMQRLMDKTIESPAMQAALRSAEPDTTTSKWTIENHLGERGGKLTGWLTLIDAEGKHVADMFPTRPGHERTSDEVWGLARLICRAMNEVMP